ncbi:putative efflux pump [Lachnellula occidentalis]|uniref:Putative efflux pump n=1 Tax=Lachnellula occidentalis TaxID=215460 RepID=A0A8H8S1B8_9HELO|nr:putative efflux pump [Lachnellula occidentalis]
MQSVFQYRRFARQVQAQCERDKKRAEAIERGNAEQDGNAQGNSEALTHRAPSVNEEEQSPDTRDVEKAELPSSASSSDGNGGGERKEEGEDTEGNDILATMKTNQSLGTIMGHALSGIEVRQLSKEVTRTRTNRPKSSKANSGAKEERETVFVVGYESEKDDMNPHNWGLGMRIFNTLLIASIGFVVGFASSIDSAALPQAAEEFGVSEVVEILATAIFLIGFGFGALFAGPISETVGRNPVYIVTMIIFMIWIMASALAPNIGAQLVFRFLAGVFGSTPLTCAGGSLSDIWNPIERGYAFPLFANAALLGPILGPVVGGFVGQSALVSWRWVEWITLIISGLILVIIVLFQPETFAPVLLKWKAQHLRKITGDERFVAPVEIRADTFWNRLLTAISRPFILTAREPIVLLFALYLTVVYIIMFTFLDGYTYIYGDTYGFSEGITGLAFLGIAIGICGSSLLVPLIHHWAKRDLKAAQEKFGPSAKLPPEKRLWFAMFGAPAVPISMFWMAWTSYSSISYWSDLIASVFFGYGLLCIFISTYQYIIDTYEMYAASALVSITLIRYVAAGGMTVVGIPFYKNLGVHWTLTILGVISALMVPVPYAFYRWGPKIRSWSKYAAHHDE